MAKLKKWKGLASELAEKLELPEEAALGASKLTVTAGCRALVENHRGILEYSPSCIYLRTADGTLRLLGQELHMLAMREREILIGGKIQQAEWDG